MPLFVTGYGYDIGLIDICYCQTVSKARENTGVMSQFNRQVSLLTTQDVNTEYANIVISWVIISEPVLTRTVRCWCQDREFVGLYIIKCHYRDSFDQDKSVSVLVFNIAYVD